MNLTEDRLRLLLKTAAGEAPAHDARREPFDASATPVINEGRRHLAAIAATLAVAAVILVPVLLFGRGAPQPSRSLSAVQDKPRAGGLAGRLVDREWIPANAAPSDMPKVYLIFNASGSWRGYQQCNGIAGHYSLNPSGKFHATGRSSGLVGCVTTPIEDWLLKTHAITVRDGELTLLNPGGKLIARLIVDRSSG